MGGRGAALVAGMMLGAQVAAAAPQGLAPVSFDALDGWAQDDHAAAFETFRSSCGAILEDRPPSRPAQPPGDALKAVCKKAASMDRLGATAARAFFETAFQPYRVGPGTLTGYYEPEIDGSRVPTARFDTPLLARPMDLVTIPDGETLPGVAEGLGGARKAPGGYEPYPDRASIEDGALSGRGLELVYAERVDAFFVHIQGSTRVRLPDGSTMRLAFDGRNGRKFTGIGRLLVERGAIEKGAASMASIRRWLADNPREGRALMRENQSYIFFRTDETLSHADGPLGAQNVPLTPGRSIAVDRGLWSYGMPFWLEGRFPGGEAIRRLTVAQDTGSAILGAARGDYFAGTGDRAGAIAGGMKQKTEFFVLLPREAGP
ncbi:murein transglycosylase A [Hansschlegelia zhihuaiae]|uniref:peptidoglycan lytic exotransglycosylase n=1 Tax=Hansschlegelia zhihuaiae TaxID=405005 RepID=A0A4Q0MBR2_9HYPH|nr:MltA domain-containing protein [Hansschlegelia zhihuaiae]RXF70299.1 lytic murein transglycosylase [Hansschlegelia zhihuaiae]